MQYQYKPHTTQAIDPDIDRRRQLRPAAGRPARHRAPTPRRSAGPAAGKTGTATNDADDVSSSWFVGFTPQLATAVMYVRGNGNDALDDWLPPYNGAAGYFGAGYPTATWTAVMKADMEGVPVEQFPPPANVPAKQKDHAPAPPPPPATHHTQSPTTSAPTSTAPTTTAPTTTAPTTTAPTSTGPSCFPPGHCHTSSPTPTTSPSPTTSTSPAAVRPSLMASLEPDW